MIGSRHAAAAERALGAGGTAEIDVAEHGASGLRCRPRPGPDIVISVIAGASTVTALKEPSTEASGWPA